MASKIHVNFRVMNYLGNHTSVSKQYRTNSTVQLWYNNLVITEAVLPVVTQICNAFILARLSIRQLWTCVL